MYWHISSEIFNFNFRFIYLITHKKKFSVMYHPKNISLLYTNEFSSTFLCCLWYCVRLVLCMCVFLNSNILSLFSTVSPRPTNFWKVPCFFLRLILLFIIPTRIITNPRNKDGDEKELRSTRCLWHTGIRPTNYNIRTKIDTSRTLFPNIRSPNELTD